jgi:hypothetical protein
MTMFSGTAFIHIAKYNNAQTKTALSLTKAKK